MKSPFYIIQDFASPKTCDYLVESSGFFEPNENQEGQPMLTQQPLDDHSQRLVYDMFLARLPEIEQHFDVKVRGVEPMQLSWMPEACIDGSDVRCGSSSYVRQKWVKHRDRDFTVHLFLSSYNDEADEGFDPDVEVYGGKLQFPQYKFSFNPQVGTMIVHPAGPQFLHSYSAVDAGDLFYVTFHFCTEQPYMYNPKDFPGDFQSWFRNIE